MSGRSTEFWDEKKRPENGSNKGPLKSPKLKDSNSLGLKHHEVLELDHRIG